jgi:Tfp pilus assembly protein PilO
MALLPSDPQAQKKLFAGIVPLLLVFAFYQFYHIDRVAEVTELETQLEVLETANNSARVLAAQGGPELQKRLAMYEQHMKRLEELIPRREEVAELLHSMGLRAQSSGVELPRRGLRTRRDPRASCGPRARCCRAPQ